MPRRPAPTVPQRMLVSAVKHMLVAGGGPAALEGALAVQRLAGERVRITLLADRDTFVAPADTAWTLPLYELALLTARWADAHELALEPWLVTYEDRALGMFGPEASRAVAELLEQAGVRLWTDAFAEAVEDGRLWL